NISNIGGTVYARQDLNITTAAKLDNSQGTVQADGKLNLQNGTGLQNQQGLIQANQLNVQTNSLNNHSGKILQLGSSDSDIQTNGLLDNSDGQLISNGNKFSLKTGEINNKAGNISHAGNDQLTITNQGELNNQSGKLLSASAISIDTQKVTNDSQNGQAG
ncbi:hypothetical protein ACO0LB_20560, partial [Undibacterium sp. SXout7W]|uniref:hypothetical protein n=1 Tax=Undibacterium sp. SXout7W TaxID=3413049 RepID=UPI003BF37186